MPKPLVALVGAEHEENLSLRYLAAALAKAGYEAAILPFDDDDAKARVVSAILRDAPIAVGISVPFQHRAKEQLGLATTLRERGYRGHITIGGHFATFEHESILRAFPAIDSAVRHEGEDTLVALVGMLARGEAIEPIPGLVTRRALPRVNKRLPVAGEGAPDIVVGPKRPLPELDDLPFPDRRGAPHDVLGVSCAPILGSRGCYADCSFCCIFAYADNADGARYRMRSPESIAAEMREEYEQRGVRLFVFHDDNFFVPDARKNIRRYERLDALLREAGMTDIALVIKCRPNDVDRGLFELLKSMGMIRAYIGIETNSNEGVVSLNRRITPDDNREALTTLRELGVYCSFNVLIFDPEATLEGVGANLDFMSDFADVPWNFCRAEVYAGTPLKAKLEAEGRLRGNYLAWDYEMRDPRVELLFRVSTNAFFGRNFKSDGLANLNMGIRFDAQVLKRFYPSGWDDDLDARLVALSRAIGEDTVANMQGALAFARSVDLHDHAAVNAFTLALSRRVARADLALLGEVKRLRREMNARAEAAGAGAIEGRFGRGMPVWAAETARLGTSTGRELSTEILPSPAARGLSLTR
jgi:anaerobic magnesium-protoporphyrin IX monomethyl ester cyclase